ncbi:hypothetical protein M0G74_01680 [Microbulbifer sp. CAU 1566]|uniref:hypothetical protein n=1 Tax=Microbulbifer sp. CAU 1566 TaxID=2933269 RepID=UPI0020062312|nr:hypothetical protein [Microbulbifer sp. CAU 1566]MCK7595976.1 hypothetical protein [Microbulbifer sp. CAU 1566]
MSEPTYSVIFRGDLQPGYTLGDVKANFARLFKAGPEMVEKLFSGRPLAIKKGLGKSQAEQLQATLHKLGAQSLIKPEVDSPQPVAAPRAAEEVPPAPQSAAVEPEAAPEAAGDSAGAGFTLAPMEGYLLKEHERTAVEPVQVPVSHLSLKPAQGNLVEAAERPPEAVAQVTVPDWTLGSPGGGKANFTLPD